jgi:hypothetical protein
MIPPSGPKRWACGVTIILSCKVSGVQDLPVYRNRPGGTDHTLHLGPTEAGMGTKGTVASATAPPSCCRKALRHDSRFLDAAARRGADAGSNALLPKSCRGTGFADLVPA